MSWEASVIGTVLADPGAMKEADLLIPSDFTGSNQTIWANVLVLTNRNALDARSLIETLRTSGELNDLASDAGSRGEAYLREVMSFRGSAIKEYVKNVLDASVIRHVRRASALIAAEADGNARTADELLEFAEKQVLALRRNRSGNSLSMADLVGIFIPRLRAIQAGTFKPAWEPDIQAIKDIVKFAEASEYIIIAGRPGEGKSSVMRYEMRKHIEKGHSGVIFNLENDPIEYVRYLLAMETGFDSELLKTGRLTEMQTQHVIEKSEQLSRMPLYIETCPAASGAWIRREARRYIAEKKVDLIGVDYVQLMSNGIENKVQDVSASSAALRSLALEVNVPVIANAQLNRSIETRGVNAPPVLSDLRESGSLEQDGTQIIFTRMMWNDPSAQEAGQFPENIDPRTHQIRTRLKAVPVQFYVLKNRNGEMGVSDPVKWNKGTGIYQTLVAPPQ